MKNNMLQIYAALARLNKKLEEMQKEKRKVQTAFGEVEVNGYNITEVTANTNGRVMVKVQITTRADEQKDCPRMGDEAFFVVDRDKGVYTYDEWEALKEAENKALEEAEKEFEAHGGKYTDDDKYDLILYHATSKENAEQMCRTGIFIGKEDGLFVSTKPDGQITGYGDTIVEFHIPLITDLELNDVFADEAHYRIPLLSRGEYYYTINVSKYAPRIYSHK